MTALAYGTAERTIQGRRFSTSWREIQPWVACPRCGVERYHLFTGMVDHSTGRLVKSLVVVGMVEVKMWRVDEPPDYTPVETALVDRMVISERIRRECVECDCSWEVEIREKVRS